MLSAYGLHLPYTMDYATEVYGKIASKLKGHQRPSRETLLADTYLIALFLQKPCESHRVLLDTFGMSVSNLHDMPMETSSQRGQVVGKLIRNARQAIRHARKMLRAVHDELNGRENKTCLLLPPKTFGSGFRRVQQRVWAAAAERQPTSRFVEGIKGLRINKRERHYEGQNGLVFKSPSKAGPRHGLPPVWDDGHEPSCVIRGRLRFGYPTPRASTTTARCSRTAIAGSQAATNRSDCRGPARMRTAPRTTAYVDLGLPRHALRR